MEKFPKIRFIIITILVITLVNVIALGLILRHSFYEGTSEKSFPKKDFATRGFDYLKEQLQLTPDQQVLFKTERDSFFKSANEVFDQLETNRIRMIQELAKKQPDTLNLYSIADDMGGLHGQLKREVVDHMLKLRSYCNPEQLVKLDSMYKVLIKTESPWRKKHPVNEEDHHKDKHRGKISCIYSGL